MHIACVSYFYDRELNSAAALLERYGTLTGWAEGLASAGATVSVVQRFACDTEIMHGAVRYHFVCDPTRRAGSPFDPARRINSAVIALQPDVAHVHGLMFVRQAVGLKRGLPGVPLLVQDHAGHPPRRWWSRASLRRALKSVDAVSFAARNLACPWIEAGLLPRSLPVFELMEGSSRFRLQTREDARAETGLTGDPFCLWVGRLDANKDPLTVLRGFANVLPHLPKARMALVYDETELLAEVEGWLKANPQAAAHITLLGQRPHAALEAIYNSADMFLLGSHHEGSGYAALEALSCGVVPILTDVPSFRVLTDNGNMGGLWRVGDAESLTQTLLHWRERLEPETPVSVRRYFETHWSFEAIGRQALAAYCQLRKGQEGENRNHNPRGI